MTKRIKPPIFKYKASLWLTKPLEVDSIISVDFKLVDIIFKALYDIKNFFEEVETVLTL